MRFTSAFALSALTVLVSASTTGHKGERLQSSIATKSSCEEADEADCKDFCTTREQTSTCLASGDKVTCYCSGGKAPESNCEERCLFCMLSPNPHSSCVRVSMF